MRSDREWATKLRHSNPAGVFGRIIASIPRIIEMELKIPWIKEALQEKQKKQILQKYRNRYYKNVRSQL